MPFQDWGAQVLIKGFVSQNTRRAGVSKKSGNAYDMLSFSVAVGDHSYDLDVPKELESNAGQYAQGTEVACGCELKPRRDDATRLALRLVSIKTLGAQAPSATTPPPHQDETTGFLGRRKAA